MSYFKIEVLDIEIQILKNSLPFVDHEVEVVAKLLRVISLFRKEEGLVFLH